MPVKLQPTSVIKLQLGIEPNGAVEHYAATVCAKHMDKYVPFKEGNLADYRIEGNKIIYSPSATDYAQYIYYGISKNGKPLNYNKDKHPLASSYWDKKMMTAEGADVIREIQEFIRR